MAPTVVVTILAILVGIPLAVAAIVYLIVPLFKAIGWLIRQVFRFIFGELGDILHLLGTIITSVVLVPLTIGNIIIGRWSASAHYGRAIQGEMKALGRCCYRILIGHPARLFCLTPLTAGIEQRIPAAVAAAPGPDRPSKRTGAFDGYKIVGSLQGGGSGGKLYVAEPAPVKLASFARNGDDGVEKVVIKSFSLGDGSSLPQIVRENRALDAAKRLGLILEHDLSDERFYYVMRYVPGESLNLVTQRLHAVSGGSGLANRELREALDYGCDLLRTLCHYHSGGLWHKDVKPDNIIVHDGQAHLVDFGLITPLRSSMTLTTHGTEYFRDPEMVRMALKGVKVHEVDGAKFDVYAAGAVLYSVIENSFPAHGGLSQITRPCPEAVRWVVRRAMTDYDKRYDSAAAMLGDLEAVLAASDPYAMKPVDLPSMRAGGMVEGLAPVVQAAMFVPPAVAAAAVGAAAVGAGQAAGVGAAPADDWRQAGRFSPRGTPGAAAGEGQAGYAAGSPVPPPAPGKTERLRPRIRVTDWWKGSYVVDGAQAAGAGPTARRQGAAFVRVRAGLVEPPVPPQARPAGFGARRAGSGVPAGEQLKRARERAHAARERARERMHRRQKAGPAGMNAGVAVALFIFLGACVAFAALIVGRTLNSQPGRVIVGHEGIRLPLPPPVPVPPAPVERANWSRQDSGDAEAQKIAHAWRHADGERVLVVCEWSKFAAADRQTIADRLSRLTDAGFKLIGDTGTGGAGASEDPEAVKEQTEAVAELRKALGTRLVASEDGAKAVHDWLDSDERADLALWITSEKQEPGDGPLSWLVPCGRVDDEVVALARQTLLSRE